MKNKHVWFEDWHIQMQYNKDIEKYELFVDLPNVKFGYKNFYLALEDGKKIEELQSILISAFDQIQKDHGGYKK